MKAKDVSKLSKDEAVKKLDEIGRSMLELDGKSQKKKSLRKSIARLKTHIHGMNKKTVVPEAKKAEKVRGA